MSDLKLPKLPVYMFAVLDLIKNEKTVSTPRRTLPNMIQERWKLSNSLLELTKKNGVPLHNDRVGWSLTFLKKAELIDFPSRGSASITESGKSYLNEFKDTGEIKVKDLKRIDAFKKFYNAKKQSGEVSLKEFDRNDDSSSTKHDLINISVDKRIFYDLYINLPKSGYKVDNTNGVLAIVKEKI